MTPRRLPGAVALALLLCTEALHARTAAADDRLIVSGNGSTLTDASGGGGGSINYLHSSGRLILGAGGEYQKLAEAHWAFGSITGAVTGGSPEAKWTIEGEAHRGAGDIALPAGTHRFDYAVEALGVSGTLGGKLTLQLEARQFDIDTTHGNLPKIGIGLLWKRRWLTTVSYARSTGGNLGTELVTLRVDHYGRTLDWLMGGATGHVAPPVVNIQTGATGAAPQYHEGYVGITRRFTRADLAVLGDYLDLSGSRRITLTLTVTVHLGGAGA